jgi:hypothetical protein
MLLHECFLLFDTGMACSFYFIKMNFTRICLRMRMMIFFALIFVPLLRYCDGL